MLRFHCIVTLGDVGGDVLQQHRLAIGGLDVHRTLQRTSQGRDKSAQVTAFIVSTVVERQVRLIVFGQHAVWSLSQRKRARPGFLEIVH